MTICNACRYCEGFCAVFPAMELRRTFTDGDLKYMANLCHNCRDCYYACQYAPPHEFSVNVPKTMAELRITTYKDSTWPNLLSGLFRSNGLTVTLITMICVIATVLLTGYVQGSPVLFGVHTGQNAFYRVIPYLAMVVPFTALAVFIIVSFWKGVRIFLQNVGTKPELFFEWRPNLQAIWDVLQLKYLDGGGHGCNYPDDRFSMIRRYLHHAVFYGFMLCLASTTVAAFYDHFLHWPAPYPILSWPVVLGTVGGMALLIGTGSLLYLKNRMDRQPASELSLPMDVGFLLLLFFVSLTGLLLLALRETPLMGILLTIHIGFVLGLFITMPYGKFVHGVYRYAALVQNAKEQSEAAERE